MLEKINNFYELDVLQQNNKGSFNSKIDEKKEKY